MTIDPVPDGHASVTVNLVVKPCAEAIDWYVHVFGATEIDDRMTGPEGTVGHAELNIRGTGVMLADPQPDGPAQAPSSAGTTTVVLFVYDADAPSIWQRALAAGAEVVFPFEKQFYGHEGGRIRDPFGHQWGIGRVVEHVDVEEMARRVQQFYESE